MRVQCPQSPECEAISPQLPGLVLRSDHYHQENHWPAPGSSPRSLLSNRYLGFLESKLQVRSLQQINIPGSEPLTAGAEPSLAWRCSSAVKRSIGFTIGFHNHGEGPYGLLMVESAY